jgi:excinuclease ABC subunit B
MAYFLLKSDFGPAGDQPRAIGELSAGVRAGDKFQTLLGVTGSGKTFTMANVIAEAGLPALIISHNKTLAAQLYGEFVGFFPDSAVEYFVSYYDYYQPEAYLPAQDLFIEKDSDVNEELDKLRLRATASLLSRDDVVIVASVSCIYGLGSPEEFRDLHLFVAEGDKLEIMELARRLVDIQYERNDFDFGRGNFRVRGDTVEIYPAYMDEAFRIEFFGENVERIYKFDPVSGGKKGEAKKIAVYPAKHFVTTADKIEPALEAIEEELEERLAEFRAAGKDIEAHRLETRTRYDLDLLREIGYCKGIENYSRHLSGRVAGERPACLLDYFPGEWLCIIDESHVTIPQLHGMYNGDRSRKEVLVEYGFRLPSALDNRPLFFEEFVEIVPQVIFTSATPGPFEREHSVQIVEQIIRPTGLVDPPVVIRPADGQVDDLLGEIRERVGRNERVLVTTLTKRMAEDLADYLKSLDIRVRYMHSEIGAIERVEILRGLRLGEFDVLVGINLLREGLDLPEVTLVAVLDADKEGFLRDERSIIQTAGRAARNVGGMVILYADKITGSIKRALEETTRRRALQVDYNDEHGIIPKSIVKSAEAIMATTAVADAEEFEEKIAARDFEEDIDPAALMALLEYEMRKAAEELEFEKAAVIRDRIRTIKSRGDPLGRIIKRRRKKGAGRYGKTKV